MSDEESIPWTPRELNLRFKGLDEEIARLNRAVNGTPVRLASIEYEQQAIRRDLDALNARCADKEDVAAIQKALGASKITRSQRFTIIGLVISFGTAVTAIVALLTGLPH